MKKVLILGASGLLGTTLVSYLKNNPSYKIVTHGFSHKSDYNGDLTNADYVRNLISETNPNIIINLVALTNVDACEQDPQSSYLLNTKVVENLAAIIGQKNDQFLVQISTDQIYDSSKPNSEEEIVLRNYYAFSKYLAEVVASKANSIILRTNFFGKSEREGRSSFTDWLVDSIATQKEITLFDDVMFSPLSINTLCSMIKHVVENPKPGIYNLGSNEGMTKAEFAIYFSSKLNKGELNYKLSSVDQQNLKAKRPKGMLMNVSKFESTFNTQLPKLKSEIDSLIKEYL